MRIVADTNTAISGLLWPGPPRRIIDSVRSGAVTCCTSLELVAELAEVMARPKFVSRLQAAGVSAADLVRDFAALMELVDRAPLAGPVCRDPDDDVVLATALGAAADLIVTGDRDLLDLGAFQGIRIVTAVGALALLEGR